LSIPVGAMIGGTAVGGTTGVVAGGTAGCLLGPADPSTKIPKTLDVNFGELGLADDVSHGA